MGYFNDRSRAWLSQPWNTLRNLSHNPLLVGNKAASVTNSPPGRRDFQRMKTSQCQADGFIAVKPGCNLASSQFGDADWEGCRCGGLVYGGRASVWLDSVCVEK